LQSFWPLQAWAAVLHPPWPLHAFFPAQSCLLAELVDSVPALLLAQLVTLSMAPVTRPANAAVASIAPLLVFIMFLRLFCLCFEPGPPTSVVMRVRSFFSGAAGS
jgi:hypothetical protein